MAVDHAGYGALQLTAASRGVLSGGQTVHLRKAQEKRRTRSASRSTGPSVTLEGAAHARWERLRSWRAAVAREHGVPAYVVFHDATLAELARECPSTVDALSRISGVGARKLERYGDDLLAVMRA
jgi:ATP-dependent DNA helicase RecQ